MKQLIRDYFTFDRRQRNGVFILLSIIFLLILYLSFSGYFFSKEKIDFTKFQKEVSDFESEQKTIADSTSEAKEKHFFSGNILISESGDDKTNHFTKHYYPKYDSLRKKNNFPKKDASVIVELNSADTTELKKLKGIGSGFAKRIIKFRELLGGFVKKEQLLEVFGFDQEKYDAISSQLTVDISKVRKININSASVEDLRKHPYIDKKTSTKIFWQRINHGNYKEVAEILKLQLADEQLFSKLAPYLTVE